MKKRLLATLLLVLGLIAAPTQAQSTLEEHPGYFPLDELEILPRDKLSIEINLRNPLLNMVALAADDDPELVGIISGLEGIRVMIGPVEGLDLVAVRADIRSATERLDRQGWQSIIRVREDDEEIYFYAMEKGGEINGLTVLMLDEEEATLINLVGTIHPEDLAGLGRGLDLPQLERAVTAPDEEKP
ncbi:MAG: DUF4252 domain-containing protein [Thermoanaerobaculia bacterium]